MHPGRAVASSRTIKGRLVLMRVTTAVAALLVLPAAAPAGTAPRMGQRIAPTVFQDLTGRRYTEVCPPKGRASVFVFLSTQCPISRRYGTRLVDLARAYGPRGVRWFAVNAMRDESVVEVARDASQRGFSFPVVA